MVNKNMIAGGIETSMLSFIENLKNIAEIDVMLFNKSGILIEKLPKDVNVYEGGFILRSLNRDCQTTICNNSDPILKKKKNILKIIKALGARKILSWFAFFGQKLKKHYDIAIAYNGLDELCSKFVIKRVKADVKIDYIHYDMDHYQLSKGQINLFKKFNKLICVSKSCAEIFEKKHPEFKDKIDYLYNFQDVNKIIRSAEEFKVDYPKTFNIVSVSRLSKEKAHVRSLKIFKTLKEEGYKFHWHIVGDGEERLKIENFINENNMGEYVTLCGNQKNPYPYIKSANMFYLGSLNEAAPMVYSESMLLRVPVITTKTRSAVELVGEYGFVCENNEDEIYLTLKQLLENKELVSQKMKQLEDYTYNNESIIKKFMVWRKLC